VRGAAARDASSTRRDGAGYRWVGAVEEATRPRVEGRAG
jgi:hypothetical protein